MSISKSKNAKGERREVEEKLGNLETQKWRNKGAFRLRAARLRRDRKEAGARPSSDQSRESRKDLPQRGAKKGKGKTENLETENQFSKLLLRQPHICREPGFGAIPVLADNDSSLTTDRKPDNW
jgi:hypothetical protein